MQSEARPTIDKPFNLVIGSTSVLQELTGSAVGKATWLVINAHSVAGAKVYVGEDPQGNTTNLFEYSAFPVTIAVWGWTRIIIGSDNVGTIKLMLRAMPDPNRPTAKPGGYQ